MSKSMPEPGKPVTLSGEWKQCDQGQVMDLSSSGFFTESTAPGEPGYLKVGANNYSTYSGSNGIHFVLGVQEADGRFSPIFVDETETGHGMGAKYQPQEKVVWWFEAGMKTSTMFSTNTSKTEMGDFSERDNTTGLFSKTSTFDFMKGVWSTNSP